MAPDTDSHSHVSASVAGGTKLPVAASISSPLMTNASTSLSRLTAREPMRRLAYSMHMAVTVHDTATPKAMVSPKYGISQFFMAANVQKKTAARTRQAATSELYL